ncbi:type IV secretory system conjugative DNA transfer family protein [Rhizobium rhizogenes]|uniref:type IV secretory system conjugative DNA transfer family protein n=1 Tax=Rhizobium rhizogenes TaxID=359 RepID=UPI0022BF60D4|nr:type IV secretory system conjugative DNA transfer family protein [Rhizobium rhizogenes]MCZ7489093.1 type IV secretory system conjugative DNA transfer family protein [Rhizobium rhizogenes]
MKTSLEHLPERKQRELARIVGIIQEEFADLVERSKSNAKKDGRILNLLTAGRSVICVDPKGENARITGRAREKFGPVHVLDPFGVTGRPSSAFNPLAMFDPHSLVVAEDASALADALVFDEPGMAGEAHC